MNGSHESDVPPQPEEFATAEFIAEPPADVPGSVPALPPAKNPQQAPRNLDAEAALLAACIFDLQGEVMGLCLEKKLTHEAFYLLPHRVIYFVLLRAYEENIGLDLVLLEERLSRTRADQVPWLRESLRTRRGGELHEEEDNPTLLEIVGGPAFLATVVDRIETVAHAPHYLEVVRNTWMARRVIKTSEGIIKDAADLRGSIDEFLDRVQRDILELTDTKADTSVYLADVIPEVMSRIQRLITGQQSELLSTGYQDLDTLSGGLQPGQMIVLAARPSMGKTSLVMNIAENVALPPRHQTKGGHVLIFSLEMPAVDLTMRMVCGRARVNSRHLRANIRDQDTDRRLIDVSKELRNAPIEIDEGADLNILELRSRARMAHKRTPLSLIVVDYLQLLKPTDVRMPREQQIAEASRGIKALAKELKIPVIVLSQLNREADKDRRDPRLSDLRESGAIEQDADLVFFLSIPNVKEEKTSTPQELGERKIIVAKNRNGATGSILLTFLNEFTRFENHASSSLDDA